MRRISPERVAAIRHREKAMSRSHLNALRQATPYGP